MSLLKRKPRKHVKSDAEQIITALENHIKNRNIDAIIACADVSKFDNFKVNAERAYSHALKFCREDDINRLGEMIELYKQKGLAHLVPEEYYKLIKK